MGDFGKKAAQAYSWTNPVGIVDNMFFKPARERKAEQDKLADRYFGKAEALEEDIEQEKRKDPFSSAGAKAAMARASRNAKQMQQRTLNTMGANATPEALIAQQGKTAEAVGSAAGQIAAGAEAQKRANINALRSGQQNYETMAANAKVGGISNIGQGWKDFFNTANQTAGTAANVAGAVSNVAGLMV